MEQDDTGRVWAIQPGANRGGGLARLKGTEWQNESVPQVGQLVAKYLATLSDGSVACLWGGATIWNGNQTSSALTRHSGDRAPVVTLGLPGLREARILARSDGSLLITETGPSLVLVSRTGEAKAITIPEEFFHNKNGDSKSQPTYLPICALEDDAHRVWLWSNTAAGSGKRRLTSFIRLEGEKLVSQPLDRIVLDREISDVVKVDAGHFWVALCGSGVYSMDIETMAIERLSVEVPKGNDQGLAWVEQIFREGDDWFVIIYPKPSTQEFVPVKSGIANVFATITRRNYDPGKPCGRLLRYRERKWEVVHDGLDAQPRFGWRERPHALTPKGLLIGSSAGGPWLTARPGGAAALQHKWETGYPLPDVQKLAPLGDGKIRALGSNGEIATVSAEPGEANARGLRSFTSVHGAFEDSRGNLWCMREAESLVKWDGASWSEQASPMLKARSAVEWWSDNRDQGWLFSDDKTAVCDFTTGAWRLFPTRQAALVAQLPKGVRFTYIGQQYWVPVYSGTGQIAWLSGFNGLNYYDGTAWRKWTMREVAGEDLQLEGGPFFNEAHQLCVPLGSTNFTWDGSEWQRAPRPPSQGDRAVNTERPVTVPEGCTVIGHTSGANDSLGTAWLSSKAGELFRAVPGRTVRVLSSEEPGPIRFGRRIRQALLDSRGGAMLLVSAWHEEPVEYLHVPAKLLLPKATAKLQAIGGNTARIIMGTTEPAEETWFSWRLDDGTWQPVQRESVLTVSDLAAGQHRLALRAYNAELGSDRTPAVVDFKIEGEAVKTMEGNIADLSHPTMARRLAAAKQLRLLGIGALPALKEAQKTGATEGRAWVDKIIEEIESDLAAVEKKKPE